jgi:hypothetical protein
MRLDMNDKQSTQIFSKLLKLCRNNIDILKFVLLNSKTMTDFASTLMRPYDEELSKSEFISEFVVELSAYDEKDFDKLIKEIPSLLKKYDKIPGDSSDPMGKIAWPKQNFSKRHLDSWETDTKIEKTIMVELERHFTGHLGAISPFVVKQLRGFLENDLYSNVIKRPASKKIYRGMMLNKIMVKKLFGKNFDFKNSKKQTIRTPFKYIPLRLVSSWTTDLSVAKSFAEEDTDPYGIILTADVDKNPWLVDCKVLYNYMFAANFVDERETIALGTVIVDSVSIEKLHDFDEY